MRTRNLQCQHMFQVNSPVTSVVLHPNQSELIIGDQSGAINMWDLKTDHNEQLMPEAGKFIYAMTGSEGKPWII